MEMAKNLEKIVKIRGGWRSLRKSCHVSGCQGFFGPERDCIERRLRVRQLLLGLVVLCARMHIFFSMRLLIECLACAHAHVSLALSLSLCLSDRGVLLCEHNVGLSCSPHRCA